MLGRTANNVYWMARYVERAENMARLLASIYHMSLLPASNGSALRQWEAPLSLGGNRAVFDERYGVISPGNVLAHMALDGDNPGSIISSVRCSFSTAMLIAAGIAARNATATTAMAMALATNSP